MGLFKAYDTHFVTLDGNTKTSGGGSNLANGQVAVVNLNQSGKNGAGIVGDFNNVSKRDKFQLRMGKPDLGVSRSLDNKAFTSPYNFSLSDVIDVRVDAPKQKDITVDDFIIGYSGKTGSEISLENGDNIIVQLNLSGTPIGFLGYQDQSITVQVQLEAPNKGVKGVDWTDQEIVEKAVEQFKRENLMGTSPLTNYVDVITVNSEAEALGGGTQFYNLNIKNEGTYSDHGRVQAQYADLVIEQTDITADFTTYTVVADVSPAAYVTGGFSLLKGCEVCPAGYDTIEGGIVYQVSLEDDGTDESATVQAIPGAVLASASRNGQHYGVGFYSVVVDDELTEAEKETFFTANPTAVIELVAEDVADLCADTATESFAWTAGEECTVETEDYEITLADTECGDSRLAELQKHYQDLVIAIKSDESESTIALSGTNGTATITVAGTAYTATFATDLATTAANFAAENAAAIAATEGYSVTASGSNIIVTTPSGSTAPTAVNASGDLAGAVTTVALAGESRQCQTTYVTTVNTNIACDECDPAFTDLFTSEAPRNYDYSSWTKQDKTYSPTAKMGIRFRGKKFVLSGSEAYMDDMPTVYTSVLIGVVGGYTWAVNENFNTGLDELLQVKILGRYTPPQNLGMDLRVYEDMGLKWFGGTDKHTGNNYAKYVFGDETRFDGTRQYCDYVITTETKRVTGGVTQITNQRIDNHIWVAVGKHTQVEALVNAIAAGAGIPGVSAFGE